MGILIGVAAILGFLFPALLIDAIKEPENFKAKTKACICFGIIVLSILLCSLYS